MARTGDKISDQLGANVLTTIISVFQVYQKVGESGLIAFGGLVHGLGPRIQINDFISYLQWALVNPDDKEVVRLACSNISDIVMAFGP